MHLHPCFLGSKKVLPATRTCLSQAGARASNTFCNPGWGGEDEKEEEDGRTKRRDVETKGQRGGETKSRRDGETAGRQDGGTAGRQNDRTAKRRAERRVGGTAKRRVSGTARRRDDKTAGRQDSGTAGRRNDETMGRRDGEAAGRRAIAYSFLRPTPLSICSCFWFMSTLCTSAISLAWACLIPSRTCYRKRGRKDEQERFLLSPKLRHGPCGKSGARKEIVIGA